MPEIKLSVRELVEFILREGDIDYRFGGMERAQEGARIHRRLQKAAGPEYKAEVPFVFRHALDGVVFTVEGRADGIISEPTGPVVDEIKTTYMPLDRITEASNAVFWAQAQCYAHFYLEQNNLPEMVVQLTYFYVPTQQICRYRRRFSREELSEFYESLLMQYKAWSDWKEAWEAQRNRSAGQLSFPFSFYRPGQRELAAAVYRAVRDKDRIFCQAPTGIGKTISTLFPSVKAVGEGLAEKIFYLTAKTVTRQAAGDALSIMAGKGLRLKSMFLTAKDKICFLEQRDCNPDACPYAKGHYDRINEALFGLLQSGDQFGREEIEAAARTHMVCPYELSLDLCNWCDCVVCDYNYLFDPQTRLRRFFSEKQRGEYVFLIDEAHNLADRAREMFSARIRKSEVLHVMRIIGDQTLKKSAKKVNSCLLALRKECGEKGCMVSAGPVHSLNASLEELVEACKEWMENHRDESTPEALLELFFAAARYLLIADLYGEDFVTQVQAGKNEVVVGQLCLDPGRLIDEGLKTGRAAALFSATLTPLEFYVAVLGGGKDCRRLRLPSPYKEENFCLLACDQISTRYRVRETSLPQVAALLKELVRWKKGNYIAYFPSYQYMEQVQKAFESQCPAIKTLTQHGGMTELEREAFLTAFDQENDETLLGFCVLGGMFAEGVDLKGDRLIGTAIVGVGLPQINWELDLLREYYQRQNGKGYQFAYMYPGMNKVLQAAGRVIRGESDRGVVLLIDDRLTTKAYRELFPYHWRHCRVINGPEDLACRLRAFWSQSHDDSLT